MFKYTPHSTEAKKQKQTQQQQCRVFYNMQGSIYLMLKESPGKEMNMTNSRYNKKMVPI